MEERCPHCDERLEIEREKHIGVCLECRKHGLIHGKWPEKIKKEIPPVRT
jgi:hypothetical protein